MQEQQAVDGTGEFYFTAEEEDDVHDGRREPIIFKCMEPALLLVYPSVAKSQLGKFASVSRREGGETREVHVIVFAELVCVRTFHNTLRRDVRRDSPEPV